MDAHLSNFKSHVTLYDFMQFACEAGLPAEYILLQKTEASMVNAIEAFVKYGALNMKNQTIPIHFPFATLLILDNCGPTINSRKAVNKLWGVTQDPMLMDTDKILNDESSEFSIGDLIEDDTQILNDETKSAQESGDEDGDDEDEDEEDEDEDEEDDEEEDEEEDDEDDEEDESSVVLTPYESFPYISENTFYYICLFPYESLIGLDENNMIKFGVYEVAKALNAKVDQIYDVLRYMMLERLIRMELLGLDDQAFLFLKNKGLDNLYNWLKTLSKSEMNVGNEEMRMMRHLKYRLTERDVNLISAYEMLNAEDN